MGLSDTGYCLLSECSTLCYVFDSWLNVKRRTRYSVERTRKILRVVRAPYAHPAPDTVDIAENARTTASARPTRGDGDVPLK